MKEEEILENIKKAIDEYECNSFYAATDHVNHYSRSSEEKSDLLRIELYREKLKPYIIPLLIEKMSLMSDIDKALYIIEMRKDIENLYKELKENEKKKNEEESH